MPVTEMHMDPGPWQVNLVADTPRWVLDAIDVRTRLWASIVITPQHFVPGTVSDANLLSLARYTGVFLGMGAGRTSLNGEGLAWWLGADGDGGDLHASYDFNYTDEFLSDILTNLVFNGAQGLTLNYTGSIAEKFDIDIEGGDTKREVLDTILGQCSSEMAWQITPGGVMNVNTPAGLWPTQGTPTVLFTPEGGHDGVIDGIGADFVMAALNGDEVRVQIQCDWDDGYNNGVATMSPIPWYDFAGGSPEVRTLIDWRPKRPRPPTEKWRKFAAWQIQSETAANRLAARELNERSEVRSEVVVEVDVFDPWRYDMSPGNGVYLYDPDTKIIDTANEVYYRGEAIRPDKGIVQQWTTPIQEDYGVYLRYWNGASMTYYDLTNWVEFESGPTRIQVGHRDRFAPKMAARTLSQVDKRKIRRRALRAARQNLLATTNVHRRIGQGLWAPNSARPGAMGAVPRPNRPTPPEPGDKPVRGRGY